MRALTYILGMLMLTVVGCKTEENRWYVLNEPGEKWSFAWVDRNAPLIMDSLNWMPLSAFKTSTHASQAGKDLFVQMPLRAADISEETKFAISFLNQNEVDIWLNKSQLFHADAWEIHPDKIAGKWNIQPDWNGTQFPIEGKRMRENWRHKNNTLIMRFRGQMIQTPDDQIIRVCTTVKGDQFSEKEIQNKMSLEHSTLPVLHIQTSKSAVGRKEQNATLLIAEQAEQSIEFKEEVALKISLRGYTSSASPKRPFNLNLNSADYKQVLLALPSANNWVLYGPYTDRSLIRNALAYTTAKKMGIPAPTFKFCEVLVNDHYQGIYMLLEKPGPNSCGLSLERDPSKKHYLYEMDRSKKGSCAVHFYAAKRPSVAVNLRYPKQSKGSDSVFVWAPIYQLITAFEKNDGSWKEQIDITSAVDYVLFNEWAKNTDAYRLSTFFYKMGDEKIKYGPVWDYDIAMGLASYNNGFNPEGWVYNFTPHIPDWWEKMMQDKEFYERAKQRWKELRASMLSDENVAKNINELAVILEPAMIRENEKWQHFPAGDRWPNSYNGKTWKEEVDYIKNWLVKRSLWMDEQLR